MVSALTSLLLSTRAETGNLSCSLSTNVQKYWRVEIHYVEEWDSEDHLKQHVRSEKFTALTELMERSSECLKVEFVLNKSTRGIDYAFEIRGFETR